jgi:hypothetical protein
MWLLENDGKFTQNLWWRKLKEGNLVHFFSNGGTCATSCWYAKKFRMFSVITFRNVNCTIKIILNVLKYGGNHKVYTEILFRCSNVNTDSRLSSKCIKLEKQHLWNLSFLQRCCYGG